MSDDLDRDKTAAKHMYWARSASLTPSTTVTPKKINSTTTPTPAAAADDTMWCPLYKWGQTRDKVVVTVFVPSGAVSVTTFPSLLTVTTVPSGSVVVVLPSSFADGFTTSATFAPS